MGEPIVRGCDACRTLNRYYVVRRGKRRGHGMYLDQDYGWTRTKAHATWFWCRHRAAELGRVVLMVEVNEQLRRAEKRIAELKAAVDRSVPQAAAMSVAAGNYEAGRADERAAVVAWLTGRGPHSPIGYTPPECGYVIEKGEHVKGGGS